MKVATIAMVLILAGVDGAFAQAPPVSRGFIVVNGGDQLTANDF